MVSLSTSWGCKFEGSCSSGQPNSRSWVRCVIISWYLAEWASLETIGAARRKGTTSRSAYLESLSQVLRPDMSETWRSDVSPPQSTKTFWRELRWMSLDPGEAGAAMVVLPSGNCMSCLEQAFLMTLVRTAEWERPTQAAWRKRKLFCSIPGIMFRSENTKGTGFLSTREASLLERNQPSNLAKSLRSSLEKRSSAWRITSPVMDSEKDTGGVCIWTSSEGRYLLLKSKTFGLPSRSAISISVGTSATGPLEVSTTFTVNSTPFT